MESDLYLTTVDQTWLFDEIRENHPLPQFFFSLRISLQKSLMYYLPGNHHLDRGYWPLQTKTYPVKRELKSSQIEVGLQDSCTMYTYMFDAVPMFSRSWIPFSCTGRLSTSIDIRRFSQKNCIQFILYFHFFVMINSRLFYLISGKSGSERKKRRRT